MGNKPTTGWWMRLDSVQRKGRHVYFQGMSNRPGRTEAVAPTVTYPYAAAVISKVTGVQLHPELESVEGQAPDVR